MRFSGDEVYHIFIVSDKETGDSDYAACTESGDIISLFVSGKSFNSDAYHLQHWAENNGFFYHHEKRRLFYQ